MLKTFKAFEVNYVRVSRDFTFSIPGIAKRLKYFAFICAATDVSLKEFQTAINERIKEAEKINYVRERPLRTYAILVIFDAIKCN